jgi:signal transduction histidine kinase
MTGDTQTANVINANLVLLETVASVVIIWFIKIEDRVSRFLMRFMYLALVIYLCYFVLPLLGLIPMTELNLYPASLNNLFTGIILQVILGRLTQLQLREKWQLQVEIQAVNEKMKWEITRRIEAASFMAMLMHELKNPLATIRIAAQSLISDRAIEITDQTKRIKNIQKSVEGIDAVLERCIETDRLEQGAITVNKKSHDVSLLLARWCSSKVQYKRVFPTLPTQLNAEVDAPLLYMVMRNLLNNALTYSPDGSNVSLILTERFVKASADNDAFNGFVIEVHNQVGRAGAPDPARVFEKYYRAPGAHHVTGTGLGLYWVHNVATMLSGGIHYRPYDNNVMFELWLPR